MERIIDLRKFFATIKKAGLSIYYAKDHFLVRLKDGQGYLMGIYHGKNCCAITKHNWKCKKGVKI